MRETQILRGLHKARATLHMQSGGPDWTTRPGANYNSTSGTQQRFDFGPEQNGPQPQGGQQYTNAQAQRPGYSNATDSAERWAENKRAQNAARDWSKPAGGDPAAPPSAPPDTAAGPKPKGGMWNGVKNMFTRATSGAAQAAPEVPPTAAQRAQAWNPKININGDALKGYAKGTAEFAGKWGRRAGKLAAPLGAALDTADVVDVATDDRMGKLDVANEVASKAGKWGAAGTGAIAGGAAGALAGGGVFSPITAPIGAIGGGLAGYFGADAAIKGMRGLVGTETTDPSERSYGVVSKALGDEDPYAAQRITAQNAPGHQGKGFTDPRVLTAEQLAPKPQDAVAGTNGRQYLPGAVTAEDHAESDRLLNSVRGQWGSNSNDRSLRAGALDTVNKAWATRGAGIKATMDPRGNGQLVFSNSTEPEKMQYVDTKGAPTTDYKKTQQFAESSAGLRAQPPRNLAWYKQMVDEQNTAYQRDVEARKYRDEQRQAGSKSFDEYLKNDPSMFVDDPEGKKPPSLDERALARKRAYIAQTLPSVRVGDKEMSLEEAFSAHPNEAKAFAQQASNEHALSEFANKYSKGAALGKGVAPGRVAVVDGPRPTALADLAANMHLGDYIETKFPWVNDQRVQIRGVDGPISVPLKDIIKDPNGRAMLEALGRLPVSK